ncbi:MAG TPA: acyl-CoA dehydrogenase family protein [Gemmataceae bacterium]|nr:acyl-CoA dehydrogenase family protein [Gemmataceae bacterium]
MANIVARQCLDMLQAHARDADEKTAWPAASWDALRQADVLRWAIAKDVGGAGSDALTLLAGYEQLAASCLTTCLILSQRDAAIRRIDASANANLRRELLEPLACGERFTTVGLSQLTTSRQHVKPTLTARTAGAGFVLDGCIPWVTGAEHADHLVIGSVTDTGLQILAALPRDLPGVHIEPALELMALQGSLTAEVRLDNVSLEPRWLLAGPLERVMTTGRSGTGGLETSCLAIGLAGAAIDHLAREAAARPELREGAAYLEAERRQLRDRLHRLAAGASAEDASALRTLANSLALRATQVTLTASKGTGFLRSHPAQRWARQALFFLVWSCPRPTAEATIAQLTRAGDCQLD